MQNEENLPASNGIDRHGSAIYPARIKDQTVFRIRKRFRFDFPIKLFKFPLIELNSTDHLIYNVLAHEIDTQWSEIFHQFR